MSDIICIKCGQTALTKCPHTRNIFPKNELATLVGNMVDIKGTKMPATEFSREHMRYRAEIAIYPDEDKGETPEDRFIDWVTSLAYQEERKPGFLRQAFCSHRWRLLPGFKSSIDHCSWDELSEADKKEVLDYLAKNPLKEG